MKTRTTRGSSAAGGRSYRAAFGVFIGVDELDPHDATHHGTGATHHGAENDARAMAGALAPVLSRSVTLVGDRATRRAVLTTIEDTMQAAAPGDLVIAYFAANTERRYHDLYLCPLDCDNDDFLATTLSFRLASAVLGSTPDVKSLIILDSCHSGAIGFDMSRYRAGSESSLMVSCGPDEFASAARMEDGRQHGVFTWALISALNECRQAEGPAWTVALIDWFDRAYTLTEMHHGDADSQNPVLLGTLSPNLTLRTRRESDAEVDAGIVGSSEAPARSAKGAR